ncbi:MAG: hypothetical protein LC803_14280 [Acidobacteria bacterium]|nr:hypothetical protein [Acidobacteriota bacterium]
MVSAVEEKLSARVRGDFQTPVELARLVWDTVDVSGVDLIIEPTFGAGSFLLSIPENCTAEVLGWEIDEFHYFSATENLKNQRRKARLIKGDVFAATASDIQLTPDASVLVIGNPPWVTNAEQGSLGESNAGKKHNLKNLPGFAALTGKANFDVSEAIILRFVSFLQGRCHRAQFALLGKFTVLRNLLQFLARHPNIGDFEYQRIDSALYFGAAVDSGLIRFTIGNPRRSGGMCSIYQGINGQQVGQVGFIEGQLIYDVESYRQTSFRENDGLNHYSWRQGIKHDVSKIMELVEEPTGLRNGLGERVEVEEEVLYQLYKSSDIFHGRKSRYVLPVFQRDLQDTLEDLPERYPKLYAYLSKHKDLFAARKSSIYKNRPLFTLFGIGNYTHATYKVALAGFYDEPVFRLLKPEPRPVALDDTSYMLAIDDYEDAVYLLALLRLNCTREFIKSISHAGDKRRFTKETLNKILIPPVHQCPPEVLTILINSWESIGSFPHSVESQLRDWLYEYKKTHVGLLPSL